MYRSKFLTWIAIVVLILGGKYCTDLYLQMDDVIEFSMYSTVQNIQTRNNILSFSDTTLKRAKSTVGSSMDSDVLISDHSDKDISGYTKYDKFYYSPIVIYARFVSKNDSGFNYSAQGTSGSTAAFKNILPIINGFEEDKTYQDIGLNYMQEDSQIKIAIPLESDTYSYNAIKDMFYIVLNDGNIPTEDERKSLDERVNNILNKCEHYEDIVTELTVSLKLKADDTIYISTESHGINNSSLFYTSSQSSNSSCYYPVYVEPAVGQYYDLYIKEGINENVIKYFYSDEFTNKSGLRSIRTSSPFSSSSHFIKNIQLIN